MPGLLWDCAGALANQGIKLHEVGGFLWGIGVKASDMPRERHAVVMLNAAALSCASNMDAKLAGSEPPECIFVVTSSEEVRQEALPVPFFGLAA